MTEGLEHSLNVPQQIDQKGAALCNHPLHHSSPNHVITEHQISYTANLLQFEPWPVNIFPLIVCCVLFAQPADPVHLLLPPSAELISTRTQQGHQLPQPPPPPRQKEWTELERRACRPLTGCLRANERRQMALTRVWVIKRFTPASPVHPLLRSVGLILLLKSSCEALSLWNS